MQASNGIQDGLQPTAELTIVAVIKTLQVHLVKIHPRPYVVEDLRGAVASRVLVIGMVETVSSFLPTKRPRSALGYGSPEQFAADAVAPLASPPTPVAHLNPGEHLAPSATL